MGRKWTRVTDEERALGLDQPITRRDLLGGMLLGTGVGLLTRTAPGSAAESSFAVEEGPTPGGQHWWSGYSGIGDYARSNGNTWQVMNAAHEIRDGKFAGSLAHAADTGELYDLVVVGGGISGLAAAYYFSKRRSSSKKCLILDNHAVFGGESKQNDFSVNGVGLTGPQGANYCISPIHPEEPLYELWQDLKLPTEFEYQNWDETLKPLEFDRTNYYYMWPVLGDKSDSIGYYFKEAGWRRNIWGNDLKDTPFSQQVRKDLLSWRYGQHPPYGGADLNRWLDGMSYEHYIINVLGLSSQVSRYCHEMLATGVGLGADTCSAYFPYALGMPGFWEQPRGALFRGTRSNQLLESLAVDRAHSFPGGNGLLARYLIEHLIPEAIEGRLVHEEVVDGRIRFAELDQTDNDVRMRLGSTAVSVVHEGSPESADYVVVTYSRDGSVQRVKARAVVMAAGGWVNKHVVQDLPRAHHAAYADFKHAAVLVANVALTNWRFLYKLGFTACRWFDGPFGFSCNLRRPMLVGSHRPPLHPDKPALLTFYAPLIYPGKSAREQGELGRRDLLSRSYRDYEKLIRQQMVLLFGQAGFDPRTDVAGVVLNRWGHAFVVPEPGFYFGRCGNPAGRDVVRQRHGRMAFAHSELKRAAKLYRRSHRSATRASRPIPRNVMEQVLPRI